MSIVDRLKQYMEHVGMQSTQFADAALIPRPTLSQVLNGRNKKISNELIAKLHDAFPTLNIEWLLFGDGPMVKGSASNTPVNAPAIDKQPQLPGVETSAPSPTLPPMATAAMPKQEYRRAEPTEDPAERISLTPDSSKKIKTIMVFYSDQSFEIFTPAQN